MTTTTTGQITKEMLDAYIKKMAKPENAHCDGDGCLSCSICDAVRESEEMQRIVHGMFETMTNKLMIARLAEKLDIKPEGVTIPPPSEIICDILRDAFSLGAVFVMETMKTSRGDTIQ